MSVDYNAIFAEYAAEPGQVLLGDGAELLDHVSSYIRRYVAASEPLSRRPPRIVDRAHPSAFLKSTATAYLAITSAEKQVLVKRDCSMCSRHW